MDYDEDPNYLDLDDILAQTQKVECKFLLSLPGLQFLSESTSQEVKQGTNLSLPYWMSKYLYNYSMIDIELPKYYKSNYRHILEADPSLPDLHKAGPYYYQFGQLLLSLRREEGNGLPTSGPQKNKYGREKGETLEDRSDIAASLLDTFHKRRNKLINLSINRETVKIESKRLLASGMDNLEKRLYLIGERQVEELENWKNRRLEMINKNKLVEALKKKSVKKIRKEESKEVIE